MKRILEIRVENGKYGIVDPTSERVIVSFDYDNIFLTHPWFNSYPMFILHRSGKVGAVFINDDNSCNWIAPCEYDRYHGVCNLFFYNSYEIRCYFDELKSCKIFSDIRFLDPYRNYIFARDDDLYYIISVCTGEILWCDLIYDPDCKYPCGSPCLVYMGDVDDLPLFFDCTNGGYIYPNGKGGLEYGNMGNVIKPIIIGGENIVNIVDKGGGIGVLDVRGEPYDETEGDYDEITIELKVSLKKGGNTEERVYQIPNGKFTGEIVALGEWR